MLWAIIFYLLHFSKLLFKTNNAKIIPLIIFLCFHITIIISITLKSNFTKKERMYKHVWTYFIYNYTFMNIYACLCMFIYVYTYLYLLFCIHKWKIFYRQINETDEKQKRKRRAKCKPNVLLLKQVYLFTKVINW